MNMNQQKYIVFAVEQKDFNAFTLDHMIGTVNASPIETKVDKFNQLTKRFPNFFSWNLMTPEEFDKNFKMIIN